MSHLDHLDAVSTGPCPGCTACDLQGLESYDDDPERYELAGESHFSWSACDACGSLLGGDRHPMHGIDEDGCIIHLDICTDCYLEEA